MLVRAESKFLWGERVFELLTMDDRDPKKRLYSPSGTTLIKVKVYTRTPLHSLPIDSDLSISGDCLEPSRLTFSESSTWSDELDNALTEVVLLYCPGNSWSDKKL